MVLPWSRKSDKASQSVTSLAGNVTREGDRPTKKWWKANSHQRLEDGEVGTEETVAVPAAEQRSTFVLPASEERKDDRSKAARTASRGRGGQGTVIASSTTPLSPVLSRASSLESEDEQYLQAQILTPPTRQYSPNPAQQSTYNDPAFTSNSSPSQTPQPGPSSGTQRPVLSQQQIDELAGVFAPSGRGRREEIERERAAEGQRREEWMWRERERLEWLRREELREQVEAGDDKKRRKWGLGPIKREKGIRGVWG